MLPKFLIADNSQEADGKIFVIHTASPRCIIESDLEDFNKDQKIHWIDSALNGDALKSLLEQAEAFLDDELVSQEELYDHEFED